MTLLLVASGVAVLLAWLALRSFEKQVRAETKHEMSEAENEAIQENIKAAQVTKHRIVTASDDDFAKLRKKWTRK